MNEKIMKELLAVFEKLSDENKQGVLDVARRKLVTQQIEADREVHLEMHLANGTVLKDDDIPF